MKNKLGWLSAIALAVLLLVVFLIRWCSVANIENKPEEDKSSEKSKVETWTCAMHPFIRSNKPGKCPICGMTLIPLKEEDKDSNSPVLTLSSEAVKLAEVQTSTVERKIAQAEVRMTGKIEYNETKTLTISTRFSGRIEKLYLNYLGVHLNKDDHIAELFSPDLNILQRELILTKNNLDTAEKAEDKSILENKLLTFEAAKNKAKIWGLTEEQVSDILSKHTITQTLNLYSPISGVVIKQNFLQGQYFKEGDTLFVISDTSELWLILDAYEQDISLLRYGQKVEFLVEAYPGKFFYGTIAFISPILDEQTRTIKVRVVVNNKNGMLKPGMFVNAVVFSKLGEKGVVISPDLKGKWIRPMHPEIIKDEPGKCDICGIDLLPAEKFIQNDTTLNQKVILPLVIPSTAPLITGKRAVVYVETKPGTYEGREVVLGSKVRDYYIINEGLKEGEKVVTNGNFKIDSELQILAKPSMMNQPQESIKNNNR